MPASDLINSLLAMNLEDGSQSQILAAVDPAFKPSNNTYFGPKYMAFGAPAVTVTGRAHEPGMTALWAESVRLTGANFGGL